MSEAVPEFKVSVEQKEFFKSNLSAWGAVHGRKHLPWQVKDPYRVWVSEIMLQQTQVSAVLGYYDRFLTHFPSVEKLAEASESAVLAQWSGLGYYARGRNLLKAAKYVVGTCGGVFPKTRLELEALPGVGKSTASAISSICFGEPVSILDANALRVIARYVGFKGSVSAAKNMKALWDEADTMVGKNSGLHTQSLMDLGASLCSPKNPKCNVCPLESACIARKDGLQESIPNKKKGDTLRRQVEESWVLMSDGQRVVVVENRKVGSSSTLWQGLVTLPLFGEVKKNVYEDKSLTLLSDWKIHKFSHFDLKFKVEGMLLSEEGLESAAQGVNGLIYSMDFDRLNAPAPVLEALLLWREQQIKEKECNNIMII